MYDKYVMPGTCGLLMF